MINKQYNIEDVNMYSEMCCEACNEFTHTHFDCPICKNISTGTTIYGPYWEEEKSDLFQCENCKANFEWIKEGETFYNVMN